MNLDSEKLSKKASRLRLSAISLSENMRNGGFRSLYKGQGIEFNDVREYLYGDNVRSIDWNVSARMGRAFVKQYEEDKELSIFLILDISESMENAFSEKSKLLQVRETAALILLAAEQIGGAVGTVFFDGEIRFSLAPKSGKKNTMILLSKLDKIGSDVEDEKKTGSALSSAILGAEKLLKKRSLIFILSDFRTSGWEKSFALLSQKNDVVAIKIVSPSDLNFPEIGTATFFDAETKKTGFFPTLSKKFKKEWHDAEEKRRENFKDFCAKRGAFPIILSTEDDSVAVLSRFFQSKKSR